MLTNTAVHQPEGSTGPALIRLAHLPLLNQVACRWTPLFVRVTTSLTWPRPPHDVRDAFARPYRTVARRRPVGEFVTDIPFATDHPSHPALDAIAAALPELDVPALLLWGPRDPVFGEIYLRDLQDRLPQTVLHRYERASHLLPEDAPGYPAAIAAWLKHAIASNGEVQVEPNRAVEVQVGPAGTPTTGNRRAVVERPSVLAQLEARADDDGTAVVEVGGGSITWSELSARVNAIAAGLGAAGLRAGDRVALLVPPSIDLTVALYAVWRAGGVIVVADRGLGLRGMGRALRGARLDFLVADTAGLLAAGPMRLPGKRIAVGRPSSVVTRAGRVHATFPELAEPGAGRELATGCRAGG